MSGFVDLPGIAALWGIAVLSTGTAAKAIHISRRDRRARRITAAEHRDDLCVAGAFLAAAVFAAFYALRATGVFHG